jgi:hypothetical protein
MLGFDPFPRKLNSQFFKGKKEKERIQEFLCEISCKFMSVTGHGGKEEFFENMYLQNKWWLNQLFSIFQCNLIFTCLLSMSIICIV